MEREARQLQLVVNEQIVDLGKKYMKDLARDYEISPMTLNRWLKKHKITVERGYLPSHKQLEIYNSPIGWPKRFIKLEVAA